MKTNVSLALSLVSHALPAGKFFWEQVEYLLTAHSVEVIGQVELIHDGDEAAKVPGTGRHRER